MGNDIHDRPSPVAPRPPAAFVVDQTGHRRAACYLRVVSRGLMTAADQHRLRADLDRVVSYAANHGLPLVAYHHDDAAVFTTGRRSAFSRLLDQIRDGHITHVLVPSHTYLSPVPAVRQGMADLITDTGATLTVIDPDDHPPQEQNGPA